MQRCQQCQQNQNLIMLICSHLLCLRCANEHKQLQQSQIQNKYWVQCSQCKKKTFSYDFSNLLLESLELSLLTDRSQDQYQINEVYSQFLWSTKQSQLVFQPRVFQRRRSMNTIDLIDNTCSPIRKNESKNEIKKQQLPIKDTEKTCLITTSLQLKNNQIQRKTHTRCQTGLIDKNKQSLKNIINFNNLTKQKTTPIQKCSSIFDYLLSLSYQQPKTSDRKQQIKIQHSSKQVQNKLSSNPKNRCHSQLQIRQKNN